MQQTMEQTQTRETTQTYLDNSATTRVCTEAAQAALRAMTEEYGNPSSLHSMGMEAEKLVTQARKSLVKLLGGNGELVFTSGATESNNLALFGAAEAGKRRGNRIVISAVEHPSVAETALALEKQGFSVIRIPPRPDGNFCAEDFTAAVDDQTILLSCMMVNNETGARLPVEKIADATKRINPDTIIHIDAVQAFGKIPFSADKAGFDLVSISGHKIYAPKGVGGLYIRKGIRILPRTYGGGQERGLRPGTESVPLIAAFAAAAECCHSEMQKKNAEYEMLNRMLRERLKDMPAICINSPEGAVPYILNLSVSGIRSEIMLHYLEQAGIYVSSGSACSKGAASPVLTAMNLPRDRADSALRISFGRYNIPADICRLTERLEEGITRLAKRR